MTAEILKLHKSVPAEDIAATLRLIADNVETGVYGLITTAVLILAHNTEKHVGEEIISDPECLAFGFGPRADYFTTAGALAIALKEM